MHSETPQVIGTLLAVPPAPPWFVERDALAGVLDTAAGSRLCFVRAPAGYGKTTLVADWARRARAAGGRVSWLSLGELHDDPRTLLRYVVAALRTSWGPIGEATLTLLNTNLPVGPSSLVTTLVNEMAALSEATWLVLDAGIGQNSISQAKLFHEALGVDGLIMTKLDGTSKGGVLLNITDTMGLPVKYIGVGESPDDLQPFNASDFVDALLSRDSEN